MVEGVVVVVVVTVVVVVAVVCLLAGCLLGCGVADRSSSHGGMAWLVVDWEMRGSQVSQ